MPGRLRKDDGPANMFTVNQIRFDKKAWGRMKAYCAEHRITVADFTAEAMRQLMKRRGI